MKKLLYYFFLGTAVISFSQCNPSAHPIEQKEQDFSNFTSLGDYLRMQAGIEVMGYGTDTKVLIRGISTIKLGTQPLYVIDGQSIGNNYAIANSAVNPNNIKSVRILRSKSETTIYGEDGTNGVILIKTKVGN